MNFRIDSIVNYVFLSLQIRRKTLTFCRVFLYANIYWKSHVFTSMTSDHKWYIPFDDNFVEVLLRVNQSHYVALIILGHCKRFWRKGFRIFLLTATNICSEILLIRIKHWIHIFHEKSLLCITIDFKMHVMFHW